MYCSYSHTMFFDITINPKIVVPHLQLLIFYVYCAQAIFIRNPSSKAKKVSFFFIWKFLEVYLFYTIFNSYNHYNVYNIKRHLPYINIIVSWIFLSSNFCLNFILNICHRFDDLFLPIGSNTMVHHLLNNNHITLR